MIYRLLDLLFKHKLNIMKKLIIPNAEGNFGKNTTTTTIITITKAVTNTATVTKTLTITTIQNF